MINVIIFKIIITSHTFISTIIVLACFHTLRLSSFSSSADCPPSCSSPSPSPSLRSSPSLSSSSSSYPGDKEAGAIRQEMQGPVRALQTSARNIAKIFIDAKLECDEEEYVKSFNAGEKMIR